MALKFREELVGKRFLAAQDLPKGRGVAEWEWRTGVVRAVLHGSAVNKDLQVLVEFDGLDWQLRESIRVHDTYCVFLVEKTLVWARRADPSNAGQEVCWPALSFTTVVDQVDLASSPVQPIEFFLDHVLDFQEEKDYCCQPSRQAATTSAAGRRQAELDEAVRQWLEYQHGQSILLTTPTVLVGYRVKVYRAEGTTQWYTAVIQHFNHSTKKLTILDDTVLEEHNEDPAVTQIVLLDGVVESILKGIDQRIIPRRRACNARDKELLAAGGGGGTSCAGSSAPVANTGSTSLVLPSAGLPSRNRTVQAGCTADHRRHTAAACSSVEHAAKQERAPASFDQPRSGRKPKPATIASSASSPSDELPRRGVTVASNDSAGTRAVTAADDDKNPRRQQSDCKRQRTDSEHSGSGRESSCPSAAAVHREQRRQLDGVGAVRRPRKRSGSASLSSVASTAVQSKVTPSQGAALDRRRSSAICAVADPVKVGKAQAGTISRCEPRNVANSAVSAAATSGLSVCGSTDKLAPEAGVSHLELEADMHYKKLHLLTTGSDDAKRADAVAGAGSAAVVLEATEKTGSTSPATGSESAGASIDKLSDCGSTSGYSTATVDAVSPHGEPGSVGAVKAEATASAAGCGAEMDAMWSAESRAAATGSSDDLPANAVRPFGISAEPVQVYRDPELLKKDEETRASRLSLVGQQLQLHHRLQQPLLPESAAKGGSGNSSSNSCLRLTAAGMLRQPPAATAPAVAVTGHQSLTTASTAAAGTGPSSAAAASAGAAALAAALPATTGAQHQQPQAAVAAALATAGRTSAQHLLSSVASAQHLAHLEQLQHMQLLQRQHELAAMAQLQLLWQQKYSGGGGGGHTAAGVPWSLLAFHEDLIRRGYGGFGDEWLDRDRLERAEKGRPTGGAGKSSMVVGSSNSSGASNIDRLHHRTPVDSSAATATRLKEPADTTAAPVSVKIEQDLANSASSAAASAVDHHFSESLRLATKKASSCVAGPAWLQAAPYQKLLEAARYGASQNGLSDKPLVGQSRPSVLQDGESGIPDVCSIDPTNGFTTASGSASLAAVGCSFMKVEPHAEAAKDRQALHPQRSATMAAGSSGHVVAAGESDGYYRRPSGEPYKWGALALPVDQPSHLPPSLGGDGGVCEDTTAGTARPEPNFSLYGFQPYQTSYISQDKLHRRLDKPPSARDELGSTSSVTQRPKESGTASSHTGSLGRDVAMDVQVDAQWSARHDDRGSEQSPKKQPVVAGSAPATRPAAISSTCRIASACIPPSQQQPSPQSSDRRAQPSAAAVDGRKKQGTRRKQESPASHTVTASSTAASSFAACSLPKRFARPSTSADPYQNLIQEGLVPNPIYSQASLPVRPTATAAALPTTPGRSVTVPPTPHGETSTEASDWRQNGNDAGTDAASKHSPSSLHVPIFVAAGSAQGGGESVIRHSFKSILESVMQKAYMQDLEEERKKELLNQGTAAPAREAARLTPPYDIIAGSSLPMPGVPPTLSPNGDTQGSIGSTSRASSSSRFSSGSSSGGGTAAAVAETDSDTLSAPSPPACLKSAFDNSNDDSSRAEAPALPAHHRHPKLKKAWLQRHSGEDGGAAAVTTCAMTAARATAFLYRQPPMGKSPLQPSHICGMAAAPTDATAAAVGTRATGVVQLAELCADNNQQILASGNADLCYHGDTTSSASEAEAESRALLQRIASGDDGIKPRPKAKKSRTEGVGSAQASPGSPGPSQASAGRKRAKPASRRSSSHKQGSSASGSRTPESDAADSDDSDALLSVVQKKRRSQRREPPAVASSARASATTADGSGSDGGICKAVSQSALSSTKPPPVKVSTSKLKKSGQPFLQDGYCCEVTPKLQKCRECKMTPHQRSKKMPNIFCRFYAFRRLRFSQRGILTTAGFSEPADAKLEDLQLWLPSTALSSSPMTSCVLPSLDVSTAKYIIAHVGDEFCKLVEQEKECLDWANPNEKIMWKRAVQGVRETCDVCDTTLFNMHWVCQKCGFVVCMDCYRAKRNLISSFGPTLPAMPSVDEKGDAGCGRTWLTCSSGRQPHDATKLTLTQIIPGDALFKVSNMIHDLRERFAIKANCPCGRNNDLGSDDSETECVGQQTTVLPVAQNGSQVSCQAPVAQNGPQNSPDVGLGYPPKTRKALKLANVDVSERKPTTGCNSLQSRYDNAPKSFSSYSDDPLSLLADVASMDSSSRDKATVGAAAESSVVVIPREVTKKLAVTANIIVSVTRTSKSDDSKREPEAVCSVIPVNRRDVSYGNNAITNGESSMAESRVSYNYYQPLNGSFMRGRRKPAPVCQLGQTSMWYPGVPHSWLCGGRLLRLHDPRHEQNFALFNQRWRLGQPVIVSNVTTQMQVEDLWSPAAFSREFGHMEGDLVNCRSGVVIVGRHIKDFWDGFENPSRRILDTDRQPMLLKLKDWPPGEDFSDLLPTRFQDIMNALPMPEYTRRDGRLNLASRLPDFFVKPDLGPKMYNAYGMAKCPHLGTTNLHLDISDAVNVMVYTAYDAAIEADVFRCIDESDVDDITRQRFALDKEVPGALWHIWDACDADKIRDLLNKVAAERGERVEPYHDPIHDQSWYLDSALRDRLRREYNVHGFAIVQCAGDAVFIPAGAPHQVQNLNSCIKVAEDFVSPEHLHHCFKLTQEFRHLSSTHSNHEDKLQVKNIIYHAVKDAVAVLSTSFKTAESIDDHRHSSKQAPAS